MNYEKPFYINELSKWIKITELKEIGKGSYGHVSKVKCYLIEERNLMDESINEPIKESLTEEFYAMKEIQKDDNTLGISSSALKEKVFLTSLHHHNIIKLNFSAELSNGTSLMFLDYCDCDLDNFIKKHSNNPKIYNMELIKSFMKQIIQGTYFIHSKKIIHRDLKPENILIKNNKEIKISDFGLSTRFSIPNTEMTTLVATMNYRAPELALQKRDYSFSMDTWSIGCIFAELLLKSKLFNFSQIPKNADYSLLQKMFTIFGTFNETILPGLSNFPFYKDPLGKKLFAKKIQGCGIKQYIIKNSDLVTNINDPALDLLEKLLTIDPIKRISCKEALHHVRN